MKYSPKFFHDSMPKWKRQKDTLIVRFFLRPISFVISSFFANLHISANMTSYVNIFVAIAAAVLIIIPNYICGIVGASLVFVWALFDCVDGNLARSYRKQPYGEYADAISSYFLVPLMSFGLGFHVYFFGGVFVEPGNVWIILVSVLSGLSDTMMRLVYHKYKEVTNHMIEMGVVEQLIDERNDHSKVNSIRVKIETVCGIDGVVPVLVLFSLIFGFVDISIAYFAFYYGGSFMFLTLLYTFKANKYRKKSFVDPEDKDKQQD